MGDGCFGLRVGATGNVAMQVEVCVYVCVHVYVCVGGCVCVYVYVSGHLCVISLSLCVCACGCVAGRWCGAHLPRRDAGALGALVEEPNRLLVGLDHPHEPEEVNRA